MEPWAVKMCSFFERSMNIHTSCPTVRFVTEPVVACKVKVIIYFFRGKRADSSPPGYMAKLSQKKPCNVRALLVPTR